jgi:hypothetical protein
MKIKFQTIHLKRYKEIAVADSELEIKVKTVHTQLLVAFAFNHPK